MGNAVWSAARLVLLALAAALPACSSTIRGTTTARASTETLLLSTAAGRAIRAIDAAGWRGKRMWIDEARLECVDKNYVVSALRAQLARAGVVLVEARDEADLVLEPRAGTMATWEGSYGVGIPEIPYEVPYLGFSIMTPPFTLGLDVQQGWTRLELFAYHRKSGRFAGEARVWGMASEDLLRGVYPSLLETVEEEKERVLGSGEEEEEKGEGR